MGQDIRAFLESIKTEAGDHRMNLEDALCLVCLSVLKDSGLQEKLSELKTPRY